MSKILLGAFLILTFVYCIAVPLNSWLYVRRTYSRKMARLRGEPAFPVNLIVPCKGAGEQLEGNLRAIAAQDYPELSIRFVTDTSDDPAVPCIERIMRETGRGAHLVAGRDEYNTCGKNYAQLVAIADDSGSEVHLICDSDMRPEPSFVREMVRPYLDPEINVTCSTRWITPGEKRLGAYTYAGVGAFSPMLMAFGLVTYVWGGCFSIRRKAFEDWDVARAWRGTEDDDLVLCNKLNERRQKPCFVPSAVSPSYETHSSLRGLVRWLTRQGQTTRLHYFPVWLLVLFLETAVSLGILGAGAYAAFAIAAGDHSWQLAAALGSLLAIMASGLLVKAPYARREDMPLAAWFLIPLIGHFVVALAFLLAVNPTMRWGKMTLTFNKDGTIREIKGQAPERAANRA
jgi:cellulose synthase/poly-beta-1,6-N-acetylglucosamine synthase-like glycosyltransferase